MSTHQIFRITAMPSINRALWSCLLLWLVMLCLPIPGWAQSEIDREFRQQDGAAFFLLTDASYASTEEAKVRLEARREDLWNITAADGAEIALYRVDRPLDFLRQQRNLHRIDLKAAARPEGLANTLSYLWDQWWRKARKVWQNIFDGQLRKAMTETSPQLKTPVKINEPTSYVYHGAYKALPGLTEVSRMRYPVASARPIGPPKDIKLDGSSSDFTEPRQGNIQIPLGKQKPGLYVVEAAVGRHRAVTLLFVTDTLAVTKTAAKQFFLWAAQRDGGLPAAGAEVVWSDLNGVLGSGRTDTQGVLTFEHAVPETSYAFGQDREGGVFISENFFYDSEIYNAKLYAYTDRPLYRPGDEVNIRLYGREFQSATQSTVLSRGPINLSVLDATGAPVHQITLDYQSDIGAHTRFVLPDIAPVGGYEIVMKRGEDEYTAAFRVAPYIKPHFEMHIEPSSGSFKTAEALMGVIRLRYPDGTPVRNAQISLSARAQILTMVDGDLAYGGLFPVQIDNNQTLTTDQNGDVTFKLPAVKEPSKVILTALASDGAAQRVRSTKDLLVERAATAWLLQAERQFAAPNEAVQWRFTPVESSQAPAQVPTRWVALHQESQTRTQGELPANARGMRLPLERSGSYTVELRDSQDRLLGAAPFWVTGNELKPPQGAIDIVMDKPRYRDGDIARALITFPSVVKDALLTLERDQVEAHGHLSDARGMATLKRLSERQWEARILVKAEHAPNITFSVAYVLGNEFGFQNAGIVVEQPSLQVSLKTDRSTYLPGDVVTVDIDTRDPGGQGVPAVLSLAAVDDMVYALQPELAPSVQSFFYHYRRNNVRTHSSLSFISFDEAIDPRRADAAARGRTERGIKVLERPRRDERDTAYFAPAIRTDAQGHARITFTVPDALTRWRLTAKAYGQDRADGLVGEKLAYVQSDKPFFARWTASTWLREGDKAQASVTLFNQTKQDTEVMLSFSDGKQTISTKKVQAHLGANVVALMLPKVSRTQDIAVKVTHQGRVVDQLLTTLKVEPTSWMSERSLSLPLVPGSISTQLRLPTDARKVRLRVVSDSAQAWAQVADSLIDYPYGCAEQTASRLIPLALALQAMPGVEAAQHPLRQRLYTARLRLASMAGPDAVFGWWGRGTQDSAFLSAYAYHADHLATQTLGMSLPPEHWERLLDIYSKAHGTDSLPQRAWALWLMQRMDLPTGNMIEGLIQTLDHAQGTASLPAVNVGGDTPDFGPFASGTGPYAMTLVLARELARKDKLTWPDSLNKPLEAAYARLDASPALLPQATLVWVGRRPAQGAGLLKALQMASDSQPTVDRALALSLLAHSAGPRPSAAVQALNIQHGWQKSTSSAGQIDWFPKGALPAAPFSVVWSNPAPANAQLVVRYESSQGPRVNLPVTLQRRLYRLEASDKTFTQHLVKPGEALRTDTLYMDEVTVQSTQTQHHVLLELGLPPGAMLETSTWGILLPGEKEAQPLERSVGEASAQGYTVPIDLLKSKDTRVVRHLIRLGQKGTFRVPAARLWRMYQPEAQATESGVAVQTWQIP
jgi:alpha-2-macroglobulin